MVKQADSLPGVKDAPVVVRPGDRPGYPGRCGRRWGSDARQRRGEG